MKILNQLLEQYNRLQAERKRRAELNQKLEALVDPTLIDRMYLDHQIEILIPKLRMIQDGLK